MGSFSCGYFIWDITEVTRSFDEYGIPFLAHGLLCLAAYVMTGVLNVYPWLGSFGLLYEASTPFMHGRKTLLLLQQGDTRAFQICQVGFILLFFLVRVCGGGWFAKTGLKMVLYQSECVPAALRINGAIDVLGTSALNAYWWLLIMKAMRGKKEKKA